MTTKTNTTSACETLGLNSGGGVARATFTQLDFQARLEIKFDLIGDYPNPFLTLGGGIEEAVTSLSGEITYSRPLLGQPFTENYSFTSARTSGAFGNLILRVSQFKFEAELEMITQTVLTGMVGVNF